MGENLTEGIKDYQSNRNKRGMNNAYIEIWTTRSMSILETY
jgi:hypothetical protein